MGYEDLLKANAPIMTCSGRLPLSLPRKCKRKVNEVQQIFFRARCGSVNVAKIIQRGDSYFFCRIWIDIAAVAESIEDLQRELRIRQ